MKMSILRMFPFFCTYSPRRLTADGYIIMAAVNESSCGLVWLIVWLSYSSLIVSEWVRNAACKQFYQDWPTMLLCLWMSVLSSLFCWVFLSLPVQLVMLLQEFSVLIHRLRQSFTVLMSLLHVVFKLVHIVVSSPSITGIVNHFHPMHF